MARKDQQGPTRLGPRGRLGPTVTWELARLRSTPVEDPVMALRLLPRGPLLVLDSYRREGRARGWISVGAHPERHIVVDAPMVSAMHAFLIRDRKTRRLLVLDADSRNGVMVNGVLVCEGKAELQSGDVLSLGPTLLLACGRRGERQKPVLMGATLHAVLEHGQTVHGSQRNAARVLDITQSTYSSWLVTQKFRSDD